MSLNTRKLISLAFITFISFCMTAHAASKNTEAMQWLNSNTNFFYQKILDNTSPPDGLPGSMIAARRVKSEPDYYYHWVRDAAITMTALIDNYPQLPESDVKKQLRHTFFDYLDFSNHIQQTTKLSDLGEPKFYVTGYAFNGPWARPQNDGPALRAISLIHFANLLLREDQESIVRQKLYDGKFPTASPIKTDLEYVSHHWKEPSYDLWEEVKGTHFYTLMVMRRALLEGSVLAKTLGDTGASLWYHSQAKQIELELQHFWDERKGYIGATINRVEGIDYKSSNLDTSVILGLLHGGMHDKFLAWNNPKVLATIDKLSEAFGNLYPINHQQIPGLAIGRYPEDRYGGNNFNGGNPWPLCTLALAEAVYEYANLLPRDSVAYENALQIAEGYVNRVKYHAYQDGSLDEQIQRETGEMTSARDLTWNYAAMITLKQAAFALNRTPR